MSERAQPAPQLKDLRPVEVNGHTRYQQAENNQFVANGVVEQARENAQGALLDTVNELGQYGHDVSKGDYKAMANDLGLEDEYMKWHSSGSAVKTFDKDALMNDAEARQNQHVSADKAEEIQHDSRQADYDKMAEELKPWENEEDIDRHVDAAQYRLRAKAHSEAYKAEQAVRDQEQKIYEADDLKKKSMTELAQILGQEKADFKKSKDDYIKEIETRQAEIKDKRTAPKPAPISGVSKGPDASAIETAEAVKAFNKGDLSREKVEKEKPTPAQAILKAHRSKEGVKPESRYAKATDKEIYDGVSALLIGMDKGNRLFDGLSDEDFAQLKDAIKESLHANLGEDDADSIDVFMMKLDAERQKELNNPVELPQIEDDGEFVDDHEWPPRSPSVAGVIADDGEFVDTDTDVVALTPIDPGKGRDEWGTPGRGDLAGSALDRATRPKGPEETPEKKRRWRKWGAAALGLLAAGAITYGAARDGGDSSEKGGDVVPTATTDAPTTTTPETTVPATDAPTTTTPETTVPTTTEAPETTTPTTESPETTAPTTEAPAEEGNTGSDNDASGEDTSTDETATGEANGAGEQANGSEEQPDVDVSEWTWNVASQLAPGNETAFMQKGIDAYNAAHGTNFALTPHNGSTWIMDGARAINQAQMEELNQLLLGEEDN